MTFPEGHAIGRLKLVSVIPSAVYRAAGAVDGPHTDCPVVRFVSVRKTRWSASFRLVALTRNDCVVASQTPLSVTLHVGPALVAAAFTHSPRSLPGAVLTTQAWASAEV